MNRDMPGPHLKLLQPPAILAPDTKDFKSMRDGVRTTSLSSAQNSGPQKAGDNIGFAVSSHRVLQFFVRKQYISRTYFDIRSESSTIKVSSKLIVVTFRPDSRWKPE